LLLGKPKQRAQAAFSVIDPDAHPGTVSRPQPARQISCPKSGKLVHYMPRSGSARTARVGFTPDRQRAFTVSRASGESSL
jgi:hypothetical protein